MKEEDKIRVSIGVTANIGNFNSIKVDVGVERSAGTDREKTKTDLVVEAIEYAQVALDSAIEAIDLPLSS